MGTTTATAAAEPEAPHSPHPEPASGAEAVVPTDGTFTQEGWEAIQRTMLDMFNAGIPGLTDQSRSDPTPDPEELINTEALAAILQWADGAALSGDSDSASETDIDNSSCREDNTKRQPGDDDDLNGAASLVKAAVASRQDPDFTPANQIISLTSEQWQPIQKSINVLVNAKNPGPKEQQLFKHLLTTL